MNRLRFFAFLLLALTFIVPRSAESADTDVGLAFDGIPLKYQRLLDYQQEYPDVNGLFVRTIEGEDPAVEAGLRTYQVVTQINDTPVTRVDEVRNIIRNHLDDTVTIHIQKLDPVYVKRRRENPFYKARDRDRYREKVYKVVYPAPEEVNRPVVVGPTRELYHDLHYNHSPDTGTNPVYPNPEAARKQGTEPCPVCFPSGESGESDGFSKIVQDEMFGESDFAQKLTGDDKRVDPPDALETMLRELSTYRLRESLKIEPRLYASDNFYAFGLSQGEIVFSKNLYDYAETKNRRAAFLAHLIAHADREHDHRPVEEKRFRSLIEEAVSRTTGLSFEFNQLKEWSPSIPGFSYYQDVLEEGYGDFNEREALFFGMVYSYRAGYDIQGMRKWVDAQQDMLSVVHPNWLDYLLSHPLPPNIEQDLRHWEKNIPKTFDRSGDGER
jgi:hypothetical protein